MDSKEFFYRLTPDRVIQAVEQLGLATSGHFLQLNSLENRVFSIDIHNDTPVVVKFYRPERWSEAQILEEHAFLFQLQKAEIPVCVPLIRDGRSLFCCEDILYAVWPRTGGRQVDEFSDEHMAMLGRLLARIHNVGEAAEAHHRPCFGSDRYVQQPLARLEAGEFLPSHCLPRFQAAATRIAVLYDELAATLPVHRIHGDCHPGNLLYDREGFFFLDFDDCLTGPAVQDFWMLFQDKGAHGSGRASFLEGYSLFRTFDPAWLRLVELLRAMRFIYYAAWIAQRWQDPAFPLAFPHFGTTAYWEQETTDLEEQLLFIEEELNPGSIENPQPQLTNKDFFWDLADE